jgi:hypothetical protein
MANAYGQRGQQPVPGSEYALGESFYRRSLSTEQANINGIHNSCDYCIASTYFEKHLAALF